MWQGIWEAMWRAMWAMLAVVVMGWVAGCGGGEASPGTGTTPMGAWQVTAVNATGSMVVGDVLTLEVAGSGLGVAQNLHLTWDGCASLTLLTPGSDTRRSYQCTPQAAGTYSGQVINTSTGAVVLTFSVVVPKPTTGFTKISAAGADLPDTATTWGCVRHNATGLLWEAHVTRATTAGRWDMHPCSWSAASTCEGYSNIGNGSVWDAASVTGSVCGKPGRLPTEAEGRALVNDPAYVAANTSSGVFEFTWFGTDDMAWGGWTSSLVVGFPSKSWYINFGSGLLDVSLSVSGYAGLDNVRLVAP